MQLNNKINAPHEKCLQIIYNDKQSPFQDHFDKGKSVSIHNRNLQTIATKMFKVTKGLIPYIYSSVFGTQETNTLRSTSCFTLRCAYSKFSLQWNWKHLIFGTQNIGYTTQWDKGSENSGNIQRCHKKWESENCSCILCE